jgi:hypothetical protein
LAANFRWCVSREKQLKILFYFSGGHKTVQRTVKFTQGGWLKQTGWRRKSAGQMQTREHYNVVRLWIESRHTMYSDRVCRREIIARPYLLYVYCEQIPLKLSLTCRASVRDS